MARSGRGATKASTPNPRGTKGTAFKGSVLNVPGKKGGPMKSNAVVKGSRAGTGHS